MNRTAIVAEQHEVVLVIGKEKKSKKLERKVGVVSSNFCKHLKHGFPFLKAFSYYSKC
jgi:hypothetical protein